MSHGASGVPNVAPKEGSLTLTLTLTLTLALTESESWVCLKGLLMGWKPGGTEIPETSARTLREGRAEGCHTLGCRGTQRTKRRCRRKSSRRIKGLRATGKRGRPNQFWKT